MIAITDKIVDGARRRPNIWFREVGSNLPWKAAKGGAPSAPAKKLKPSPHEHNEITELIGGRSTPSEHARSSMQKVGNRHHWEDWANDIARSVGRIRPTLPYFPRSSVIPRHQGSSQFKSNAFADELRDDV